MIIDSDDMLGGNQSEPKDQRSMVPDRTQNAYKLPGADSCNLIAVKTFLKNKTRMSVLLRLDNTMAVAYINNLWGPIEMDLFASHLTAQCPAFFS